MWKDESKYWKNEKGPDYPALFLLTAGIAYHLYIRDLEVPVLGIALLHAGILRHIFRIFLHVVHGCVGHNTSRRYRMTDMVSQGNPVAPDFPGAAIGSGQQELLRAIALG